MRTPLTLRASSGGLLLRLGPDEDPHDVALLHDQVLNAVDLDLRTGPFSEQHSIAGLDVDRNELAGLVASTGADSNDLALLRLLLGGVGNDDAAGGLLLGLDALDDDAVMQRTELHRCPPPDRPDFSEMAVTGATPPGPSANEVSRRILPFKRLGIDSGPSKSAHQDLLNSRR
jgi:hypothetical protein